MQRLVILFLRLLALPVALFCKKEKGLGGVIPSSLPSSSGDEAMAKVCFDQLCKSGFTKVVMLSHSSFGEWDHFGKEAQSTEPLELLMAHPFQNSFKILRIIRNLSQCKIIFFTAGDMLDGHYDKGLRSAATILLLLFFLAKCNSKVVIVGCSINKKPKTSSLKALRLVSPVLQICARDLLSFERMNTFGIKNVIQTADSAFLLSASANLDEYSSLLKEIEKRKNQGDAMICFNTHFVDVIEEWQKNKIATMFACTIQQLLEKNSKQTFVFIGHDNRKSLKGADNDFELHRRIIACLSENDRRHCLCNEPTHLLDEKVRVLAPYFDIACIGSMHLAIALLASGIPVGCFTYQDKFEGLFRYFENALPSIQADQIINENSLEPFVHTLFSKKNELHDLISRNLPFVTQQSLLNFPKADFI